MSFDQLMNSYLTWPLPTSVKLLHCFFAKHKKLLFKIQSTAEKSKEEKGNKKIQVANWHSRWPANILLLWHTNKYFVTIVHAFEIFEVMQCLALYSISWLHAFGYLGLAWPHYQILALLDFLSHICFGWPRRRWLTISRVAPTLMKRRTSASLRLGLMFPPILLMVLMMPISTQRCIDWEFSRSSRPMLVKQVFCPAGTTSRLPICSSIAGQNTLEKSVKCSPWLSAIFKWKTIVACHWIRQLRKPISNSKFRKSIPLSFAIIRDYWRSVQSSLFHLPAVAAMNPQAAIRG